MTTMARGGPRRRVPLTRERVLQAAIERADDAIRYSPPRALCFPEQALSDEGCQHGFRMNKIGVGKKCAYLRRDLSGSEFEVQAGGKQFCSPCDLTDISVG